MSAGGSTAAVDPRHLRVAGLLRANRRSLSMSLARLVAEWPKYADQYAADPEAFAVAETEALVDYMALVLEGSDAETFRSLYIGEKAKQFHDETVNRAERQRRVEAVLNGEQAAFRSFVDDHQVRPTLDAIFDYFRTVLANDAPTSIDILFVGDCLYLDVLSFLVGQSFADGVTIRPTFVTSHDAQEQRAALTKLVDRPFGAIFYSPFSYGFDDGYANLQRPRSSLRPNAARHTINAAGLQARATLDTLVDLFEAPIFVHTAAPVMRRARSVRAEFTAAVTAPARHVAAKQLSKLVRNEVARHAAGGARIHLVDETEIVRQVGLREASRYYYHTELQHPAKFGALVAEHYRDIVLVCARLLTRKVLVCDLDNTLWDGVIGEGLGVTHHRDRQKIALRLKNRGVVLAINSKNDPAKISWSAEGCHLAADDFVSSQINWYPKVVNMRRIAEHLNLKEKDFVFVDDRADERSMVENAFPTLLTFDALDERTWQLFDLWATLLPAKQNADRTDFYRQRDARIAFLTDEAENSQEERAKALAALDLRVVVRQAGVDDLDRVTELVNRTNQFNMTGARVTAAQIKNFSKSPDHRILVADAADRFGAMGTISVLILEHHGMEANITHFVLSCRVFGYGMEFAVLDRARKLVPAGQALTGSLNETPFNDPCRAVYRDAGFMSDSERWNLTDAAASVIAIPATLTVSGNAEPFSSERKAAA